MRTGKLSVNVLKRSVLRPIKKRRAEVLSGAGIGEDCAIFSFAESGIVTCTVQGMLEYMVTEGATEGQEPALHVAVEVSRESESHGAVEVIQEPVVSVARLIQKAANKLASYGAEPVGVMIALILPQELEEPQIKMFLVDAEAKAKELNLEITGVQTSVTGAVGLPIATVTGIGKLAENAFVVKEMTGNPQADERKGSDGKSNNTGRRNHPLPGQDVVISKWIGLEGTAALAKANREKLLTRYPAYLVEEAAGFDKYLSIIPEAATAGKSGVCAMQDASEGGIFACLWEMAERAGVGLTIDMRKLPLRQETVEVCELCGVNPYELMSGGCLVMTTEDGVGLVTALHEAAIPAVIVGKVTDSNDRILLNGEEVRYMDKPQQDELYRLCKYPVE